MGVRVRWSGRERWPGDDDSATAASTFPPSPFRSAGTCSASAHSMTDETCRRAPSNSVTSSRLAPFCGPNTALAPSGPVSGLVTSQAAMTCTSPSRLSRPLRSTRSTSASAAPPGRTSRPSWSSSRTPNACRRPQPASLVALPPSPTMIVSAPASSAAICSGRILLGPEPKRPSSGFSDSGILSVIVMVSRVDQCWGISRIMLGVRDYCGVTAEFRGAGRQWWQCGMQCRMYAAHHGYGASE